jgi:hypothetical protein
MTGSNLGILGIIILGAMGAYFSKDGVALGDAIKILGGFIGGVAASKALQEKQNG